MPDITMCKGGKCPMKEVCYRFIATPSERQSYFMKSPWKKKNDQPWCEYLIQVQAHE